MCHSASLAQPGEISASDGDDGWPPLAEARAVRFQLCGRMEEGSRGSLGKASGCDSTQA